MIKTKISMYLTYWFENIEKRQETIEFLSKSGLQDAKYMQTKSGDNGIIFSEISVETLELEDLIREFLNRYDTKVNELNLFSDVYKGFFVIEIVPEIHDMEKPSLVFELNFLEFIKKIKSLKQIDIDQYIY